MADRNYRQYCPVAHALDLVGDRWVLLIVRDLFLGPKRFTDLRQGLPGIGTNVLTDRLKALERTNVIRHRTLPPPAASAVYELTDRGRELEGPLVALARWGGQTLGPRLEDQRVSTDSVMLALRATFTPVAERGERGIYEARFAEPAFEAVFGVRLGEHGAEVTRGPAVGADAAVYTDAETLYAVASGRESLPEAIGRGAMRVDGDPSTKVRLRGRLDGDVEDAGEAA